MKNYFLLGLASLTLLSCGKSVSTQSSSAAATNLTYQKLAPEFNADSAYNFVKEQVDFGFRIPNSKEHEQCGDFLVSTLERFKAEVIEQKATLTAFDGTKLKARNIIGVYNPENTRRIMLAAHWDSRPFADKEKTLEKKNQPIQGANDGASGVGVLLEVARQLSLKNPEVGVDIIFFDAEDYGDPSFMKNIPDGEWWCLGSQYWGENPHVPNYKASFGILLDMVGAKDATFYYEYHSNYYGANILDKVWSTARKLGHGKNFISKTGGGVLDDHYYVNKLRNFPCIDIIDLKADKDYGFVDVWHTHRDTMENIDKETLFIVGETLLEVIYNEK